MRSSSRLDRPAAGPNRSRLPSPPIAALRPRHVGQLCGCGAPCARRRSQRGIGSLRPLAGLVVAALLLTACVEELPPIEGTASLRIEVISPTDLGSEEARLPDADRALVVSIRAIDTEGEIDAGFNSTVSYYAQFLGSLTPGLGTPLGTVPLQNGVAENVTLELPPVFGPTFLWVEDAGGAESTFATGTSETLFYRDPFLEDISRPLDETALDALFASPLESKQVVVNASRHGANGKLIVTGSFAQGYTVSDVSCAGPDGQPPCTVEPYDSIFVFSFSRPENEFGNTIFQGQFIDSVGGAISEFNGLTEVGFPTTTASDSADNSASLPEPAVIQASFLTSETIELERLESGLVAVENATLCPLGEAFETFGQWSLDVGNGCDTEDSVAAISAGVVPEFDPTQFVGQVFPRVVGTLRPVNIDTGFNVWIIHPRNMSDITLP